MVKFEIMYMPDASWTWWLYESGQVIPVTYNGIKGEYSHCMYVDNHPAIAVGREASAFMRKSSELPAYLLIQTRLLERLIMEACA